METLFGMHWTLAVTILCLIMIALDLVFWQSDILTYISDILLVFVVLHFLPTDNLLWQIFFGIIIYAVILSLHWQLFRKVIIPCIDKFIAPQKSKDCNEILIGKTGKLCFIDGRTYIYVENEYIPCVVPNNCPEGSLLKVESWNENRELIVKPSSDKL